MATGWDEAGRFYTDTASEHGLYPATSDTLSEIGQYLANLTGGTVNYQTVSVSVRFVHNTTKD